MRVKYPDEKNRQKQQEIHIAGLDAGFDEKSRKRRSEIKTGYPRQTR